MKNYCKFTFAAMLLTGASAFAGAPAAPYDNTRIDARLNVAVKDDTKVVHFVRDNADPNVITKAYEIKHTDPYELRSYIRAMVQTRKVTDCKTNVEAVKYSDGSALLLISAEDYRFNDTPGAQGFDSIVKELDKPKLVSSSGRKTYVYSPKFRSSAELKEMISNVGIYGHDLVMSNLGGTDVVMEDTDLNLLFFNTAPFSFKPVMDLLKQYDRPAHLVRAKITVYEIYAENDTKLGLDFQSWKNNEGIDLFNAGGRFSRNYAGNILDNAGEWRNTTYYQFNPKWNTKYIDFLTSKGKAKILQTAEFTLQNNVPAYLSKCTQVFAANSTPLPNNINKVAGATTGKMNGNQIDLVKSNKIGFGLVMFPKINAKATTLAVKAGTSSLLGYASDGTPRRQPEATIDTEFMISNEGTKLVIGGLEKRSVMKVSGGVPFLKDLPGIGWLFSTETEATKRSQLLVVAEVVPEKQSECYKSCVEKIRKELSKAGESNTYGYRQYLLDADRK